MINTKKNKVYFIVLNYNGYSDTVECLQSLQQMNNQNFQVVVVDNASSNNEGQRLMHEFSKFVHILNDNNYGFAGGNNVGITCALAEKDCDYIFFLNNDTAVEPDMLDQLLNIVNDPEYCNYGFFQPKMINYNNRCLIDSAGLEYSWNSLGFNRGANQLVEQYNSNQEVLGCCGGAFLCRRQAVEVLHLQDGGFFAEQFFAYSEDMDVSLRLQWAGWQALFVAKALVYHKGGVTANKFSKCKVFWSNRNSLWVVIRNWPLIDILKNFHWLILGQGGMIVNSFIRRRKLAWWSVWGKIKAIQGLPAMWRCRKLIQVDHKNWLRIKKLIILKWRP